MKITNQSPRRLSLMAAMIGIAFSAPLTAFAADKIKPTGTEAASTMAHPDYSDRTQMKLMTGERELLQRELKIGQKAEAYLAQLAKLGYMVTAVNDQEPGYLEYEIVKGRNSHEVQIDRDKTTGLATKIDVTANLWRADSTKAALKGNRVDPVKTAQFSDRGYRKGWTDDKAVLAKALVAGQDKGFYLSKLQELGYQVTSTNEFSKREIEYEVVKGTHSYEVQLNLDAKTGKVKSVDVSTNLWESAATERALEGRK